jgi:hypothetical protein
MKRRERCELWARPRLLGDQCKEKESTRGQGRSAGLWAWPQRGARRASRLCAARMKQERVEDTQPARGRASCSSIGRANAWSCRLALQ